MEIRGKRNFVYQTTKMSLHTPLSDHFDKILDGHASFTLGGRGGRMVVGFTTTYAIIAYHH